MAEQDIQGWLAQLVQSQGAVAGTVHVERDDDLFLAAHVNIPPPVQAIVRHVPYGKGMAGLAQTRMTAVQTCNLKSDKGGAVRPGARAVDAHAATAVPVLRNNRVVAVVGLAFGFEGDLPPEKLQSIAAGAEAVPLPTPATSSSLTGTWRVAYGITPSGEVFDGTLQIDASGPVHRLRWDVSIGEWFGLGLLVDGALVASQSGSEDASGVAVYLNAGDGGLAARWTHPSLDSRLGSELVSPNEARTLDGEHAIRIWRPAIAEPVFEGTLKVTSRRFGLAMDWSAPSKDTFEGVGLGHGSLVGASWWKPGAQVGIGWFERLADGKLSERWVSRGSQGLGRVVLEPA